MSVYKLIIEEFACWGCKACEVACKQEYNQPPFGSYDPSNHRDAVKYLSVWNDGPKVVDGKLDFIYRVNVCKHCNDPVCVTACPEGAIKKDPETGIVLHDKDLCNGCNALGDKPGTDKQETSPCKVECPAHIDIQGYVSLTAKRKYLEALKLIKETSPFPSICGRVCYHPCESRCHRNQIDEPVAIQSIERFLADLDFEREKPYLPKARKTIDEKVAVIGSGPAGLTAAYFLARDGYRVTVYEKLPVAGGMMAVGIPEYRLPRDVIAREIEIIRQLGVEILTGFEIGKDITIKQLREQGTRAFFLAIGAHECKSLDIEGEDLKGVYPGVDFLRDVNLGKKVFLGKRVAVIGGGNVAVDAVRTALRTGSKQAFVLYRQNLQEMPASPEEVEECLEEGIRIHTLTDPKRIIGENGKVKAVECVRMELDEPDESGRKRPVPIEGSEFLVEVDAVVPAIGQESDWACLGPECACTLSDWGTMTVNTLTLQTDDPDIFAGGDAVTGPGTIIEAIAAGRRAAASIDRYLRGLSLEADRGSPFNSIMKPQTEKYDLSPRAALHRLEPRHRSENFAEVRFGLTERTALQEAKRCILCGISCLQACPYDAISYDQTSGKILKCNLCYSRVTNGLYPACADNICLAHCIYFGDPTEIEKKILEKRKRRGGCGEIIPRAVTA